ncbi:MAG: hypothetical protein M3520_10200, partial [Actinomycetota bacterium]|nr:hypothetical protein [Actinomycetota bacterium]
MSTATVTTAAHPAPRWAADPSSNVLHERGEDVHPDDACTWFTRQIAAWETTPEGPHIEASELRVTLHAQRHDDGQDADFDTACVWEHGKPVTYLAAAPAGSARCSCGRPT